MEVNNVVISDNKGKAEPPMTSFFLMQVLTQAMLNYLRILILKLD